MSEQGDWHFVEEDIVPAEEIKASFSSVSDESEENLQFLEAGLTHSYFQKDAMQQSPPPPPLVTEPTLTEQALVVAAANTDDTEPSIIEEFPVNAPVPSEQREEKKERNTFPPQVLATPPTPTPARNAVISILHYIGHVLFYLGIYVIFFKTFEHLRDLRHSNKTQISTAPPSMVYHAHSSAPACANTFFPSSSTAKSRSDPWYSTARLSEDSVNIKNKELNARIGRLEEQLLSTAHRLGHHDHRLTSLESKITELTEMVLKSSSCGAHFYKSDPRFDPGKAVQGREGFQERLFVEARTKMCQHGSSSKELIQASPQCTYDTTENEAVLVNRVDLSADFSSGIGHEGESESEETTPSVFLNENNDGNGNKVINELQDRIAALEHGMEAIHSLLSTSSDDIDREFATLSANIMRLQEKIEELDAKI